MQKELRIPILAMIFLLAWTFAHAGDGEPCVLIGVEVGEFSWSEGEPAPRRVNIEPGSGTIRMRGRAPDKGETMEKLAIGFPPMGRSRKLFLVFSDVKISGVETRLDRKKPDSPSMEEVEFVFQAVIWTYFGGIDTCDAWTGDDD